MTNPETKPKFEILFGPIASGKSTYAARRAAEGALVSNVDAIVSGIHGGAYAAYEKELTPLYKAVRSQIIHTAATLRRDVIVDSLGLTRERREHFRTMAKGLGMSPGVVVFRKGVFNGPADGRRRFKADPRGIPKDRWIQIGKDLADSHDPLTEEELRVGEVYDFIVKVGWRRGL